MYTRTNHFSYNIIICLFLFVSCYLIIIIQIKVSVFFYWRFEMVCPVIMKKMQIWFLAALQNYKSGASQVNALQQWPGFTRDHSCSQWFLNQIKSLNIEMEENKWKGRGECETWHQLLHFHSRKDNIKQRERASVKYCALDFGLVSIRVWEW